MPFTKQEHPKPAPVDATPSSAPETFTEKEAPIPAIDVEMLDGDVVHAVFATDTDAQAWLSNLSSTTAHFVGVKDTDGLYHNLHVAAIKSTTVVGVATPPPVPEVPYGANVPLTGSNLAFARYLPATKVLTITFRSQRRYEYADVPADVYAGLLRAPSAGKYFDKAIRGHYAEKEIPL